MRGYFGIGVEKISKIMNIGSLFRSAHAFGASFVFTINSKYVHKEAIKSDTSEAVTHIPFYSFPDIEAFTIPKNCKLVAVELIESAIDLPNFCHPSQAAYILGPERGDLSQELLDRCDFTIRIPTKFCINLGVAGAIVMYDRLQSFNKLTRFQTDPFRISKKTSTDRRKKDFLSHMSLFQARPPSDYNY